MLTLLDGGQLRARIVDVECCTTRPNWVTSRAYPDAASNHTTMGRSTTDGRGRDSECVTGVPSEAGAASYTPFQAVVLSADGFLFTPSFVLEDMDAQVDASDPSRGCRETMTSLGAGDGQLVFPQLSTTLGALVGVRRFAMPPALLTAVGLPAVSGLSIDGPDYLVKPTFTDGWAALVRCERLMQSRCCCSAQGNSFRAYVLRSAGGAAHELT